MSGHILLASQVTAEGVPEGNGPLLLNISGSPPEVYWYWTPMVSSLRRDH